MTIYPAADAKVALPYGEIAGLCRKYEVEELWIFGSVLRDDFQSGSDIDFLAFRNNDLGPWMGKLFDFQDDLSKLLRREVDVVERDSVEKSENYIRRKQILNSAKRIYVAG